MRPRRIYIPLTHDHLRSLAADRVLAAPLVGIAPALNRTDSRTAAAAAEEEAEYAAFTAAAERAAEQQSGGTGRRVIAAADVPAGALEQRSGSEADVADGGGLEVRTTEDLPIRFIVSLHIDEESEPGDLLWYDITELDGVLEELGLD